MGTVVGMEVRPTSLGKTHKACISEESEKTPNQEERSKNYTKENTRNSNERCLRNEGANITRCPWQQRQTIARLQRQLVEQKKGKEKQGTFLQKKTHIYIYIKMPSRGNTPHRTRPKHPSTSQPPRWYALLCSVFNAHATMHQVNGTEESCLFNEREGSSPGKIGSKRQQQATAAVLSWCFSGGRDDYLCLVHSAASAKAVALVSIHFGLKLPVELDRIKDVGGGRQHCRPSDQSRGR